MFDWSSRRDALFAVLAHPVKRTILRELVGRDELSASTFTRSLEGEEIPLPEASRHMRDLRDRGLLELSRTTNDGGGIERLYRLTDEYRYVGAVLAAGGLS
jgi:DNA-binding transcriptional ArsR family regulator